MALETTTTTITAANETAAADPSPDPPTAAAAGGSSDTLYESPQMPGHLRSHFSSDTPSSRSSAPAVMSYANGIERHARRLDREWEQATARRHRHRRATAFGDGADAEPAEDDEDEDDGDEFEDEFDAPFDDDETTDVERGESMSGSSDLASESDPAASSPVLSNDDMWLEGELDAQFSSLSVIDMMLSRQRQRQMQTEAILDPNQAGRFPGLLPDWSSFDASIGQDDDGGADRDPPSPSPFRWRSRLHPRRLVHRPVVPSVDFTFEAPRFTVPIRERRESQVDYGQLNIFRPIAVIADTDSAIDETEFRGSSVVATDGHERDSDVEHWTIHHIRHVDDPPTDPDEGRSKEAAGTNPPIESAVGGGGGPDDMGVIGGGSESGEGGEGGKGKDEGSGTNSHCDADRVGSSSDESQPLCTIPIRPVAPPWPGSSDPSAPPAATHKRKWTSGNPSLADQGTKRARMQPQEDIEDEDDAEDVKDGYVCECQRFHTCLIMIERVLEEPEERRMETLLSIMSVSDAMVRRQKALRAMNPRTPPRKQASETALLTPLLPPRPRRGEGSGTARQPPLRDPVGFTQARRLEDMFRQTQPPRPGTREAGGSPGHIRSARALLPSLAVNERQHEDPTIQYRRDDQASSSRGPNRGDGAGPL
ncbi:hypothetical protein ACQY0O_006338 [Thecaphora frezii]